MYEIKIKDEFSGAHNLRNYKGKCEELHGHNWKVEVSLSKKALDEQGMVMDFKSLKETVKDELSLLDHKYLNDSEFFKKHNPTSENIAFFLHNKLSKRIKKTPIKVSVWETDSSCASYNA
jgi:6-pyruvoyltetrahydropterin/6-carboxytetrahydropterin synthase